MHRLEQTYEYLKPGRFAYTSTTFEFACEIRFDASGLVLDHPGIARRIL